MDNFFMRQLLHNNFVSKISVIEQTTLKIAPRMRVNNLTVVLDAVLFLGPWKGREPL